MRFCQLRGTGGKDHLGANPLRFRVFDAEEAAVEIDDGFADRLCPSHDCICLHIHNEQADGSIPEQHDFQKSNPDQYLYMHRHVIPELQEMGVDDATINQLFIDNPRRFFGG